MMMNFTLQLNQKTSGVSLKTINRANDVIVAAGSKGVFSEGSLPYFYACEKNPNRYNPNNHVFTDLRLSDLGVVVRELGLMGARMVITGPDNGGPTTNEIQVDVTLPVTPREV